MPGWLPPHPHPSSMDQKLPGDKGHMDEYDWDRKVQQAARALNPNLQAAHDLDPKQKGSGTGRNTVSKSSKGYYYMDTLNGKIRISKAIYDAKSRRR